MRAIVTSSGLLTIGRHSMRVALGRGGIVPEKREGDGGTPVGVLPLRRIYYRPDRERVPVCAVSVRALQPHDGWCDDPRHPDYNRAVTLPIDASAETLWRDDHVYDIIGVLGWNDDPVVPGRGSAIFLHLARPNYEPTEGCVALAADDLRRVLALGATEFEIRTGSR
jgi:L,D-peptidoglycan transpeptidase YkuD (ErfK/YbiS/YcfS/YnhG family)